MRIHVFFIAFSILLYSIISRFLRINLVRDLNSFNILFTAISCILFFFLCCFTFYRLFTYKKKVASNRVITCFINKLNKHFNVYKTYFKEPLITMEEQLNSFLESKFKYERIDYINDFLRYMNFKILRPTNFTRYNKYFIIYYSLKYIPKLFCVLVFVIELFYYQRLFIFYWILPLLLLPLLADYLKYMIFAEYYYFYNLVNEHLSFFNNTRKSSSEDLLPMINFNEYMENYIDCLINKKEDIFYKEVHLNLNFYLSKPGKIDHAKTKENYIKILDWVKVVFVVHYFLTKNEVFYTIIINFIIYTLYFIGWIFILLHLIFS